MLAGGYRTVLMWRLSHSKRRWLSQTNRRFGQGRVLLCDHAIDLLPSLTGVRPRFWAPVVGALTNCSNDDSHFTLLPSTPAGSFIEEALYARNFTDLIFHHGGHGGIKTCFSVFCDRGEVRQINPSGEISGGPISISSAAFKRRILGK